MPASFTNGIVFDVSSSGVSDNAVKLIVPPCPNTAYNSEKFSLLLRNDSLILSPVPSLPSTPIFTSCLAIIELRYITGCASLSTSKFTLTPQPQLDCALGFRISKLDPTIDFT